MILGLTGNRTKDRVVHVLPAYTTWLREHGVNLVISEDFRDIQGLESYRFSAPEEIGTQCDVLLSFGGDGTLLNTVRLLQGTETPVLGVNLGGLGYLTEVGPDELYACTEALLDGRWSTIRRMILEVSCERKDGTVEGPWFALNDAVLDKAGFPRLISIKAEVNGQHVNHFRADGLILATPTGSTGYNLSAGGPILEPELEAIIMTPLNPHSLSNRPLIINSQKEIRIVASSPMNRTSVAVDGEAMCDLANNEAFVVRRSDISARLIHLHEGNTFYEVLRKKLGWGGPGNGL